MASRYWVGGGSSTNWTATASTNWGSASNTMDNASVPVAGDDVFFNGVGASANGTSVISANITIGSIDFTGFTGTLTQNATTTLTLDSAGTFKRFTLASGMTYAPTSQTRIIAFTGATGTTTIDTAGKIMGAVTIAGATAAIFQLTSPLTLIASAGSIGVLTVTSGKFNSNTQAISTPILSSTGAGVAREIDISGSTVTLTGVGGTMWDFLSAAGNLTFTATGSTIVCACAITMTSGRVLQLGTSKTYNIIVISDDGIGTNALSLYNDIQCNTSTTIGTLTLTPACALRFATNATQFNIGTFNCIGTAANNSNFIATGSNAIATVNITVGATIEWTAIYALTFSGVSVTANNSYDLGRNLGTITINGPSGGGGGGGVIGVIGS